MKCITKQYNISQCTRHCADVLLCVMLTSLLTLRTVVALREEDKCVIKLLVQKQT